MMKFQGQMFKTGILFTGCYSNLDQNLFDCLKLKSTSLTIVKQFFLSVIAVKFIFVIFVMMNFSNCCRYIYED